MEREELGSIEGEVMLSERGQIILAAIIFCAAVWIVVFELIRWLLA